VDGSGPCEVTNVLQVPGVQLWNSRAKTISPQYHWTLTSQPHISASHLEHTASTLCLLYARGLPLADLPMCACAVN
jgi:hypothetical protein